MARFERQSPQGTKRDAAVKSARQKAARGASIEDTMFFPRLRRHAKWVFVFLALVFALGFVGFGVGAGGVGVGDIFRDGGSEAQSVEDARKRTEKEPESVQAWRDLSAALQTEGDLTEAVEAIRKAIALDADDPDLHRELAGAQLGLATVKQTEAREAQVEIAYRAPAQLLPGLFQAGNTNVFADPIGSAIAARATERGRKAAAEALVAASGVVDAYRDVVKLLPEDPNVQLELAGAAEQAGDYTTAIGAYERFLELAPDDTQAPIVKQQVELLRGAVSG